jgi:hypothetical protein
MKVKLNQKMKGRDGKPIGEITQGYALNEARTDLATDEKGNFLVVTFTDPKGEAITLKDICIRSLLSDAGDNPQSPLDKDIKAKRYALFYKLSNCKNGTVELESEEITTIKDVIWLVEGTLMAGQACNMLEDK